ncbi:hypothetical protein ACHAXA_006353 [Cyclostephanos tholiformis]|uniref:Uncharacterized protein n=1 Tax=Cyclostephanos tholiformis TaxID=382380 RepID=A0ABD3RB73_9STRA
MEDQLELTELRRAQRELNAAFGFRRSINTDEYGAAFDRGGRTATATAVAGGAGGPLEAGRDEEEEEDEGTTATSTRKRRLVRRRKKKTPAVEGEDAAGGEMGMERVDDDAAFSSSSRFASTYPDLDEVDVPPDADFLLRAERTKRLTSSTTAAATEGVRRGGEDDDVVDWFKASEGDVASAILDGDGSANSNVVDYAAMNRFRSQLSVEEWNSKVMSKEDELSPLSMVMKRLAILEEEKNAADRLIEEEYRRRMDNEDKYYLEKRKALEDAIMEIQESVYGGGGGGDVAAAAAATGGDDGDRDKKELEENGVTKFAA